jgi:DNA-binding LacI/PurR family transcriptional regulator
MIPPLQRITLVTRVSDALRRGLEKREWLERLPPEQDLADHLQVSRSTLRAAMKVLIKEGLLRTSTGRRAEIVPARRVGRRTDKIPVIGVLSPYHSDLLQTLNMYQEPLRQQLESLGFRVEFHVGTRFYSGKPGKALEELLLESRVDCWLLLYSTAEMQRWFAQRKIIAIVDGTCHEGVCLPAIDVDYRAVCRHAVGVLLGLGHRRIALLIPKTGAGGDLSSVQGFQEGLQKHHARDEVQSRVIHPEPSVEGMSAALRRVLSAEVSPTAIVVKRAPDMFTVLTHLMHAGSRVPHDISLICVSDHPFLGRLVPSIAHYSFTPDVYARQLTQMISKVIRKREYGNEQRFILPRYQKGDSVGPCRNR